MNLKALCDLLSAAGLGRMGETLFIHTMPDVDRGILFRMPLSGVKVDQELPGRYRHKLQVIVRGVGMQPVIDIADRIVATLTLVEAELPGMYVTFLRPDTLPIIYPRSEQSALAEASINFDCCYVVS